MATISLNEWPEYRKQIRDHIGEMEVMLGELEGAFNSRLSIPLRTKSVDEILNRYLTDES